LVLYIYAGTLFLSAFILFLVQPIIGKMILPKLGGTPQVWNTCMVFFQMVLLAGYAYTHTSSTRLPARRQLLIHAGLLFIPLIVLFMFGRPFNVDWWNAPPGVNPIPSTLFVLVIIVGLPFFVVSTSAPLLQRWFVYTGHPAGKDPYFLYGASNLGSLLALFLYPVFIEHYLSRAEQAWLWAGMYVLFIVFVLYSALTVWEPTKRIVLAPVAKPEGGSPGLTQHAASEASTGVTADAPKTQPKDMGIKKGPAPRPAVPKGMDLSRDADLDTISSWRRFRWIALAAVPSSLMLGVTTHITTDLSPIPLFWLITLGLYLLSFIFVFAKWPVVWVDKPHHLMLLVQPAAIALMFFMEWRHYGGIWTITFVQCSAFFATALVCHGELAKDRPSVKHLTEFYLMMSVGGMLGGVFNGLIAPIIPIPYVWEFSLAVICACLFRPVMKEFGWVDELVSGMIDQKAAAAPAPTKPGKAQPKAASVALAKHEPTAKLALTLDLLLPLALCALMLGLSILFAKPVFSNRSGEYERNQVTRELYAFLLLGVPLIIACFFYARPLRFALSITAIILFHGMLVGDSYMHGDRSYFGIIRVRALPGDGVGRPGSVYHSLMHGNIDHGMNFRKPGLETAPTLAQFEGGDLNKENWGKQDLDFSRLSSTYYHRYGPVGVIMERWNWSENYWHWDQNVWHADARMPASLVGLALADGQMGALLPGANPLVHTWSEPPLATVGLGTGTMASYARPYQSIHFYEIDNHIKKLSLPESPKGKVFFTYLLDARERGADVRVYLGDAYQRMKMKYYNFYATEPPPDVTTPPGGPDNYYKMMVVDAFSSDAIPVHLLTVEAFKVYFDKLTKDGVLCVHTSNRYVDLPKVVVDVAHAFGEEIGEEFIARRGHDISPFKSDEERTEHYTSEWVMVMRKSEYQAKYFTEPTVRVKSGKSSRLVSYRQALQDRNEKLRRNNPTGVFTSSPYWDDPRATGDFVWTLDHSNLFRVLKSQSRADE